jgi:hypothetical protein
MGPVFAFRASACFDGERFVSGGATVLIEDGRILGVEPVEPASSRRRTTSPPIARCTTMVKVMASGGINTADSDVYRAWRVQGYFGFDYTLAVVPSHLDPAAAQTLNILALKLVFPFAAGGCVFGVASSLAILRGAKLPNWLGWAAIGIGIGMVTATPGALIGIVLFIFWTATVSVLIFRRSAEGLSEPSARPAA